MNFGRCLYFSTTVNCESNILCSVALFMWWGVYIVQYDTQRCKGFFILCNSQLQYGGGKERVLHLGVLELLFNEQRCHCENCIVYKFFMLKYLYGICICRKVYFGF